MKINVLILQVFISLFMMSCTTPSVVVRNSGSINYVHEDSFVSYGSMFEDFQLIPLENNHSCMLSNAQKMEVIGDNFYIMDKGSVQAIYNFDKNGRYKGQISKRGHSKNEYTWLFDFTTMDDSLICLLDVGNIVKSYDTSGTYISAKKIDTKNYYWTMDYSEGRFILSSLYNGTTSLNEREYLLYFFDDDFKLIEEKIQIPEKQMAESPLHHNPSLCVLGNKCVFLDIFQNKFFVFDLNDLSFQDEYEIKTPTPYTYEDMVNGNAYKAIHDKILSVFCDGKKIFGWMLYNKRYSYYGLNLDTKEAMVCDFLDMVSIETMTFKDGYVYAVVQPNSLKNIQNAHEKSLPTFSPELLNVINPHKERLDSKNNFFILRMKPKNKLTYCNLKK